ncbi:hypothetical protein KBZ00_25950 [Streptomyces sp. RK31]|uniref:hypothetical protein n=1 Tax=Streptomyces sp. RK31 TaxID=2824892 RepID=UPI001B395853|nr:hypothetical protein [Streptomyces sp. RK31]MBQ0974544.1 hypothetical protein [Streptomyces sp. RK31]
MSDPILPTRIIPAGEALPAPAAPPPAPPAPPGLPPDWWRTAPGPSGPPAPVPVDVHVHLTIDQGGWQSAPDPEPGPRWWQRIRWGYNLALAALSLTLAGPWGALLASVRDEESLAGAWVMAAIPLVVLGYLDNARRVEATAADPDLWAPKWRAALARFLLWAAVLGAVLTLPITTLVYALTGVKPA